MCDAPAINVVRYSKVLYIREQLVASLIPMVATLGCKFVILQNPSKATVSIDLTLSSLWTRLRMIDQRIEKAVAPVQKIQPGASGHVLAFELSPPLVRLLQYNTGFTRWKSFPKAVEILNI